MIDFAPPAVIEATKRALAIKIATEPFTAELYQELLPLGQKCWDENTAIKKETCAYDGSRDFQIEPDFDQYKRLADSGVMAVVTLRDEGELKGYVSGFVYRSLHHKKFLAAFGDTIYVEPDYRSYSGVMVDKFLNEMRALKAEIIGWPTTPKGHVYELLKSRGFVADDVVMELKLCASL